MDMCAFLRLCRWMTAGSESRRLWNRPVRWVGGAPPGGEEPTVVHEAIVARGLRTYGEVATYTADRLYQRDFARSGSSSDVGFFASWYLAGACKALERLRGRFVLVGEPEGLPTCRK